MEILVALYAGEPVQLIARRRRVSENTVRSQVRSLLHKLDASSQLQAVATYRQADDWLSG
jgi:DNA-binding NarL/FixJ family response regulator